MNVSGNGFNKQLSEQLGAPDIRDMVSDRLWRLNRAMRQLQDTLTLLIFLGVIMVSGCGGGSDSSDDASSSSDTGSSTVAASPSAPAPSDPAPSSTASNDPSAVSGEAQMVSALGKVEVGTTLYNADGSSFGTVTDISLNHQFPSGADRGVEVDGYWYVRDFIIHNKFVRKQ